MTRHWDPRFDYGESKYRLLAAAIVVVVVLVWIASCRGAGYKTPNFSVSASTSELAKEIGDSAERWRVKMAELWLGETLPAWSSHCPIVAKVAPNLGAGGETSFQFDRGEVFGWRMSIQGSRERILDSVLPHEITHTIFASHFRQPVPRWADEGACTTVETQSEQARQERLIVSCLKTKRGIPFSSMFAMQEYPSDAGAFYAQGHSLAQLLIESKGRAAFLSFLADGMEDGNWPRAVKSHYGDNSLYELQNRWLAWVKAGRPQRESYVAGKAVRTLQCVGGQCSQGWVGVGAGVGWGSSQQAVVVPQNVRWDDERVCRIDGGTGVHIELCGQAYILSCAHETIDTAVRIGKQATAQSGKGGSATATVVASGTPVSSNDLSLWRLNLPADQLAQVKTATLATVDPRQGETLWVSGFPRIGPHKVRSGVCTGPFGADGSFAMHGNGQGGESGAPIFNGKGQLAGILWGAETDGNSQSINTIFTPASKIAAYLSAAEARLCPNDDPAPNYPIQPITQQPNPQVEPSGDDDGLKSLLVQIDKRLTVIEQQKSTPGEQGERGQIGPRGPQGPPGDDGQDGADGKDANLDLDELAAEVVTKLPKPEPFWIRVHNKKHGTYTDFVPVFEGDYITLTFSPDE